MASEKISDMTAATETGSADLVPIVQGGVNKKATKTTLFHGTDGQPFDIRAGSGPGAALSLLTDAGGTNIVIDDGDDSIQGEAAGFISFTSASELFLIAGSGHSVDATYVPNDSGDWDGAPEKMHEAIDRLAHALATLLGVPIP